MSNAELLHRNRVLNDEALTILMTAKVAGREYLSPHENERFAAIEAEINANASRIVFEILAPEPAKQRRTKHVLLQCSARTRAGQRCSKKAAKESILCRHHIGWKEPAVELPEPRKALVFPKVSLRLEIEDVVPAVDVREDESVVVVGDHFISDTIAKRASAMLRDAYSWQRLQRSRRWEGLSRR